LAEIAAGVLGTVATWVASTGSRAAGREAQTPRLVGACERQARGFLGGALRCLACSESSSQKNQKRRAKAFYLRREDQAILIPILPFGRHRLGIGRHRRSPVIGSVN
jgi:hypothetical protein